MPPFTSVTKWARIMHTCLCSPHTPLPLSPDVSSHAALAVRRVQAVADGLLRICFTVDERHHHTICTQAAHPMLAHRPDVHTGTNAWHNALDCHTSPQTFSTHTDARWWQTQRHTYSAGDTAVAHTGQCDRVVGPHSRIHTLTQVLAGCQSGLLVPPPAQSSCSWSQQHTA